MNVTYRILQTVNVTCHATDPLSGMASTNCTSALVNAPVWTSTTGPHSVSATATDNAGNVTTICTSFTVSPNPVDLGALATQFVQGSTAYKPPKKGLADVLVSSATFLLSEVGPHNTKLHNAFAVAPYEAVVAVLGLSGYLTHAQQFTLDNFAQQLI